MKVIFQYSVGEAEIQVVKTVRGYQYIINKPYTHEFSRKVRDAAEIAIMSNPSHTEIYSIAKRIARLLKTKGEQETAIVYSLRESLKYRKLQVLIDDPYVEDISAVGPGPIWVRHSRLLGMDPSVDYIPTNLVFDDRIDFLQHLLLLAERSGRMISKANPIVDGNLPEEDGGHRIHLVLPDIAGMSGEIVVRKKKPFRSITLEDLRKGGMLDDEIIKIIERIIKSRGSLLIVGPPGSGKTTLLRAILYSLVPRSWKVAIIEDTPEIDPPPGSSWVRYIVPLSWGSVESLDQFSLTKAALRASVSKFLVIGETRGKEARVLAQAMNMGLGGLTTFHGGSASEAIMRLSSHPISLGPTQITMFDAILTLGFLEVNKGGLRRTVVSVDKPFIAERGLELKNIYRLDNTTNPSQPREVIITLAR